MSQDYPGSPGSCVGVSTGFALPEIWLPLEHCW